jgi:hypothetical protein
MNPKVQDDTQRELDDALALDADAFELASYQESYDTRKE